MGFFFWKKSISILITWQTLSTHLQEASFFVSRMTNLQNSGFIWNSFLGKNVISGSNKFELLQLKKKIDLIIATQTN